jgi:hypothetical protein
MIHHLSLTTMDATLYAWDAGQSHYVFFMCLESEAAGAIAMRTHEDAKMESPALWFAFALNPMQNLKREEGAGRGQACIRFSAPGLDPLQCRLLLPACGFNSSIPPPSGSAASGFACRCNL